MENAFIFGNYDLTGFGFDVKYGLGKKFFLGTHVLCLFNSEKKFQSKPVTYLDPDTKEKVTDQRALYAVGMDISAYFGYSFFENKNWDISAAVSGSWGLIIPKQEDIRAGDELYLQAENPSAGFNFSKFQALFRLKSHRLFVYGGAGAFCNYGDMSCNFMMTLGGGFTGPN